MAVKTFEEKYPDDSKTRNTVSGLTNSKTASADKVRDIDLVAYHIYSGSPLLPQSQQLKILQAKGFKIPPYVVLGPEDSTVETRTAEVKLRKRKNPPTISTESVSPLYLPLPLPRIRIRSMWLPSRFSEETAVTTVINVEWNVSKQGLFKPRVNFEKVFLDGVGIEWPPATMLGG